MKKIAMTLVLIILTWSTAAAGDSGWTLRFHAAIVQSSDQQSVTAGGGGVSRVEVGDGGGIGVAGEYRLTDLIGLEMSTLLGGVAIDTRFSAGGSSAAQSLELSLIPLTFGVPFHFAVGRRVDIYVGPTLSYVIYEDFRNTAGVLGARSSTEVSTDTAPGIAGGLEVGFGQGGWAFNTGLRYVKTGIAGRDFDPLIVTLGFAYRF